MLRASVSTGIILGLAVLVSLLSAPRPELAPDSPPTAALGAPSNPAVLELDGQEPGPASLLALSDLAETFQTQPLELARPPLATGQLVPMQEVPTLQPLPERPAAAAAFFPHPSVQLPSGRPDLSSETPASHEAEPSALARVFWLQVSQGSAGKPAEYRPIPARLSARGQYIRIYADCDDRMDPRTIEWIIECFDRRVLPQAAARLGLPKDVDGDGTFAILMTSWLDRLEDGRASLAGMVRPADFRRDLQPPWGNRADLMYLNAAVRPGPQLEMLLAQEFAHAVSASGGGGSW